MKRIFNLTLPPNEIKIKKIYEDNIGLKIIIEAGDMGWNIIYYDGSTMYKDYIQPSQENFNDALNTLKSHIPNVHEINN